MRQLNKELTGLYFSPAEFNHDCDAVPKWRKEIMIDLFEMCMSEFKYAKHILKQILVYDNDKKNMIKDMNIECQIHYMNTYITICDNYLVGLGKDDNLENNNIIFGISVHDPVIALYLDYIIKTPIILSFICFVNKIMNKSQKTTETFAIMGYLFRSMCKMSKIMITQASLLNIFDVNNIQKDIRIRVEILLELTLVTIKHFCSKYKQIEKYEDRLSDYTKYISDCMLELFGLERVYDVKDDILMLENGFNKDIEWGGCDCVFRKYVRENDERKFGVNVTDNF